MGKDRPMFDASSADRRDAFKCFVADLRDFCVMEDYVNPAKPLDDEDYWISAKRPKAMAALRCAFPQAEWDVLMTTIDSQIPEEEKQNPAQWLAQFSLCPETIPRNVYPSMAYSRAFGISEVQFSSSSR